MSSHSIYQNIIIRTDMLMFWGDRKERCNLKEGNIGRDQVPAEGRRKTVIPCLGTRVSKKNTLKRLWIQLGQVRTDITNKTSATKDTRFNREERLRRK